MKLNREKYKQEEINKNLVQSVALEYWKEKGCHASCYMATGTGKSRVGILASQYVVQLLKTELFERKANILLVVPLEKLRDENWKEEFDEWDKDGNIWDENLQRTTYVSLSKYKNEEFDLIILDEAHHITELNFEFFEKNNNIIHKVLALTATPPEDKDKRAMLKQIAPPCFLYTLEEAENDELVAPFELFVIKSQLDRVTKNIPAGNEKRRWYQTEGEKYDYITDKIDSLRVEKSEKLAEILNTGTIDKFGKVTTVESWQVKDWKSGGIGYSTEKVVIFEKYVKYEDSYDRRLMALILDRMHLLNSLPSKTELAKRVLAKVHEGKGKRTIVFGGSIKQVNEVCGKNVYHSSSDTAKQKKEGNTPFDKFKRLEIDILGVVRSVNEGHSIQLLDQALVIQLNSKELDIIQRIGRIIRFRKDHTGRIYIIVCEETVDENWFKAAMKSFAKAKFKYFNASIFD